MEDASAPAYTSVMMDEIARQYASPDASSTGPVEGIMPATFQVTSTGSTEDHGEKLSAAIEENCLRMRRSMLDFYRDMRNDMLASRRAAVDAERALAGSQLRTKQEEVELLRDDLAAAQGALSRSQAVVTLAAARIAALNERWRERRYLGTFFWGWRAYQRRKAKKKADMEKARQWYTVHLMQRVVMRRWLHTVSTDKKRDIDKRVALAVRKAQDKCAEEHSADIASLRGQLLAAQRALAAEKQGREMLAQDMKRSFMRGVCALNMEAMQVMKRGMPPGGMNPNPTLFTMPQHADESEPQPEAIPASVQNMMSAMNAGPLRQGLAPPTTGSTAPQPMAVRHSAGAARAPSHLRATMAPTVKS